jgi:hypothetical protein
MFSGGSYLILSALLLQAPITPRLSIAPLPHAPAKTVETGLVVLSIEIDPNGKPSRVDVMQGPPPFIEPSVEAVRQWIFVRSKEGPAFLPATVVFLFRARTLLPASASV